MMKACTSIKIFHNYFHFLISRNLEEILEICFRRFFFLSASSILTPSTYQIYFPFRYIEKFVIKSAEKAACCMQNVWLV